MELAHLPQKLGKRTRVRIEMIEPTALLKSALVLRRVQETCCLLDSRERPPVKTGMKNWQRVK